MMKRKAVVTSLLTVGTAIAIAAASCGKKKSDDEATTTDTVAANPAAVAYPTSLAISTFPTTTSTTLTLADADPSDSTGAAKKSEQDKILKGEADSCVPKIMGQKDEDPTSATNCYQFDQEMIYGTRTNGSNVQTYGTTDGKDSAKEACLVSFARSQAKRIVAQVDRSLGMAQMALCERKKAGDTAVPAVDQEIDLAKFLAKAMPKGTVNSAKMKRLADAADGFKVFTMSFDVSRPDGVPMTINITHSPKNDANTSYTGVIYTQIEEKSKEGKADAKKRLLSIMYDRTDDKFKYSLRTAKFASSLIAGAIGTDGQVEFNSGAAFTGATTDNAYGSYTGFAGANDALEGIVAVAFEGNPTTNEGTFSYWLNPGGTYRERARGLVASLKYDAATSTLSGCAVSGAALNGSASGSAAGVSIRSSIKESLALSPNGAYHPFFNGDTDASCGAVSAVATDATGSYYTRTCGTETRKWYVPGGSGANGTTFVTAQQPSFQSRQCFKQNAAGLFEIDTAKTTGAAGYDLIASTDTANTPPPPGAPAPGKGVGKK